jgi:5'-3' exonuclease
MWTSSTGTTLEHFEQIIGNRSMKRLLIVDGLNLYIRNYIANPTVSENGDPIGGLKGFLSSLQLVVRRTNPDKIVIAWDGDGGSAKKRTIVKGYKGGRKPVRLNRFIREQLTEEQQIENKAWQFERLLNYLYFMPIHQISIDGFEADDVISYVNQMEQFEDWLKIIVSTDKDFYQCVSATGDTNHTVVYRPREKSKFEVVKQKTLMEEYDIHPSNFVYARTMEGDKSDNLPGVSGVGIKTVGKRFPFLSQNNNYCLQDIFDYCEKNIDKAKIYDKILQDQDIVRTNHKMMQLDSPSLSPQAVKEIKTAIEQMEFEFQKTEVVAMTFQDGFPSVSYADLYAVLKRFVIEEKNSR